MTDTESMGTNKQCRWSSVSNSKSWLKVFLIQHDIITIPHDPRLSIPWETNSASRKTGSNWSAAKRRHRFNPWRDEGGRKKKNERPEGREEATDDSPSGARVWCGGVGVETDSVYRQPKTRLEDNSAVEVRLQIIVAAESQQQPKDIRDWLH